MSKIAEEHLQTANNIYCGMAFGEFVETELTEIIAQALADAEAKGIEKAAKHYDEQAKCAREMRSKSVGNSERWHRQNEIDAERIAKEIRALIKENG